ncbi:MAG: GNAT family N-acetyltransferase [Caldilineaceae bacterium]
MKIQFTSVALAEIQPTLQHHISAFPSPIDSFLEDHILASNHYEIRSGEQRIGWTAIHEQSLITQFALLPAYRHLGQAIFAQVRKLEMVRSAFVPTCDEFFLAHALDDYRQLDKQAYFFQHSEQREPYQSPLALRHRQASRKDIPTIQQLSGDFFDKLAERIDDGQIYISEREWPASGEIVGFGILDKGRLCLGVASCGMFVVESARRQGVGAAIIATLMGRCAELGLRPVAGCWYYNHNSKKTLEEAGMFTQTRLLRISY